jgi:hypothetical protein
LDDYAQALRAIGIPVCKGTGPTYWVSSTHRAVQRLPTFEVGVPSHEEVDAALRTTGGLFATYAVNPDYRREANAWLYLSEDRDYALRQRTPAMQRNIRRAERELTIDWISPAQLLAYGEAAFCDTRQRSHLDDATATGFHRFFNGHVDQPGRTYLGAWKDGQLVAFVTVIRVDDWAEIGSFSMTSMLRYRPNDALMSATLKRYLGERDCRVVSYGLSSIQTRSNARGLHRFKTKVGFDAIPVHRAFVLHPHIRPFATTATLKAAYWVVNGALWMKPRNRRLRKLAGMLACMLGSTPTIATEGRTIAPSEQPAIGRPQLS